MFNLQSKYEIADELDFVEIIETLKMISKKNQLLFRFYSKENRILISQKFNGVAFQVQTEIKLLSQKEKHYLVFWHHIDKALIVVLLFIVLINIGILVYRKMTDSLITGNILYDGLIALFIVLFALAVMNAIFSEQSRQLRDVIEYQVYLRFKSKLRKI